MEGKWIDENVTLAREITHMMNKTRSKVLDKVEWSFLEPILINLGFHSKFVQWIMQCIMEA